VKNNGLALNQASDEVKNDEEVVMSAVKREIYNGLALHHASDEARNDKEVVMLAVKNNGLALHHASDEIKNDKEVVMLAVKNSGSALNQASDEVKNDKEVVMLAVKNNGLALNHASDELKNDKEVVTLAVKNNGLALNHASDELKNDKEIVMSAVKQDGRAFQYASGISLSFQLCWNNKRTFQTCCDTQQSISIMLMRRGKVDDKLNVWHQIPTFLRRHCLSFLPICLNDYGWYASHTAAGLRNDKEVVMCAMKSFYWSVNYNVDQISFASDKLRNDQEVMLFAVNKNIDDMKYASKELRSDKKFVLAAALLKDELLRSEEVLGYVSDEIRNDKEFMINVFALNCYALNHASNELKNDPDIKKLLCNHMAIYIRTLRQRGTIRVNVESSDTIADVKVKIHEKTGISVGCMRLIHKGKTLVDERSLSDCNILAGTGASYKHGLESILLATYNRG
jgi:CxxC motif-containing protein